MSFDSGFNGSPLSRGDALNVAQAISLVAGDEIILNCSSSDVTQMGWVNIIEFPV